MSVVWTVTLPLAMLIAFLLFCIQSLINVDPITVNTFFISNFYCIAPSAAYHFLPYAFKRRAAEVDLNNHCHIIIAKNLKPLFTKK